MSDLSPTALLQDQPTLPPTDDGATLSSLSISDCVGRRFGKYEFIAELGRGGMGIVFKADQTDLHRTVAIKMILGATATPELPQRHCQVRRRQPSAGFEMLI